MVPARYEALLQYGIAFLAGLWLTLSIFPRDFLLPPPGALAAGLDSLQHAIAQRYFIAEPWGWPLLAIRGLMPPEGSNLAFLDGIPLLALPLKLLRGWLPPGFHAIHLWYGIAWALQPMAAVFCIRGTGERRWVPVMAFAVIAASLPAWYARYGHAALTGHFLLLLALGLYARQARGAGTGTLLATALLPPLILLVHPYLAVMALALLGAAPVTWAWRGLALRGGPAAWRAASATLLAVAAATALCGALLVGLDYLGAKGGTGYGHFAMNLLSPVWPHLSGLQPFGWAAAPVHAPGTDGFEGYNWLGFGILAAVFLGVALRARDAGRLLGRHVGLVLALLTLAAMAVSLRPALGDRVLFDSRPAPFILEQFRASGRLFWPVAYALALAGVLLIARLRVGAWRNGLLVLVAALQFADVAPARDGLREMVRTPPAEPLPDLDRLGAALAAATQLNILPSWHCLPPETPEAERHRLLSVVSLAADRAIPVNTMYVARWRQAPHCADATMAVQPLARGEARLLLPPLADAAVPGRESRCTGLGWATLCRGRPDDPAPPAAFLPPLPPGRVTFGTGADGTALLGEGWARPESWGAWSNGDEVALNALLPAGAARPRRIVLRVRGFGPRAGAAQPVEVFLDGRRVDRWSLGDGVESEHAIALDPGREVLRLAFRIGRPTMPWLRGMGQDIRRLGMALVELRGE